MMPTPMNQSQLKHTLSQVNLTTILVAVNVLVFLVDSIRARTLWPTRTTPLQADYGEIGCYIARHDEWWRLFTGAFLHNGTWHLFFNMVALWLLGRVLENLLGVVRFFFLYSGALLAGAFGVLLLSPADIVTVGASGAVFGLMGAALVLNRLLEYGFNLPLLVFFLGLNLLLTFIGPNISVGGHLGGLVGGLVISFCYLVIYRAAQTGYFNALANPSMDFNQARIFTKFRRREVIASSMIASLLGLLFFLAGLWAADVSTAELSSIELLFAGCS